MIYPFNNLQALPIVSREVANRFKEMGFNWPTNCYYSKDINEVFYSYILFTKQELEMYNKLDFNNKYLYTIDAQDHNTNDIKHTSAPTLDLAEKWLRDVYSIRNLNVFPIYNNGVFKAWGYVRGLLTTDSVSVAVKNGQFKTYEEAQEAVIINAINF